MVYLYIIVVDIVDVIPMGWNNTHDLNDIEDIHWRCSSAHWKVHEKRCYLPHYYFTHNILKRDHLCAFNHFESICYFKFKRFACFSLGFSSFLIAQLFLYFCIFVCVYIFILLRNQTCNLNLKKKLHLNERYNIHHISMKMLAFDISCTIEFTQSNIIVCLLCMSNENGVLQHCFVLSDTIQTRN